MKAKITRLSDGREFDYLHGIHSNGDDLDWYATVSDEDAIAGEEVELEWSECIIQLPLLPNIIIDEEVDSFDVGDWLLEAKIPYFRANLLIKGLNNLSLSVVICSLNCSMLNPPL